MSVFKKGYNKVDRRVVLPGVLEALTVQAPAGAVVKRIYAQNRSTTATNLSVGNTAAGEQYLAAVAVPVATDVTVDGATVRRAGILSPKNALQPAVPKVDFNIHVTLSAYPSVGDGDDERGLVDVVIEYEEMWDSLPIPQQHAGGKYGY